MNDLTKALEDLKENCGKSAKDLSKWIKEVKGKKEGYSESAITNAKQEGKGRKYYQLIKFIEEYTEYCMQDRQKDENSNSREVLPKIELYYNERFYVYFFDVEDVTKRPGISRAILSIGRNENEAYIKNVDLGLSTDYKGEVSIHASGQHIIFNLKTQKTDEKNLYMNFIISPEVIPPIALGEYCNIDKKGALIAGSLILEHIKDTPNNKEDSEAKTFFVDTPEYKDLNPHLRRFLFRKEQNYMKVTTGIFSYKDLEEFFIRQKYKKRNVNYPDTISGIFVSAPMNSIPEEYPDFRVDVIKLTTELRKLLGCEVYFAGEHLTDNRESIYPPLSFKRNFNNLEKLDKFILIYHKKITSSVLVEVGWALKAEKSCIFFVRDEQDLPFLLRNIEYPKVRVIPYKSVNHIIKLFSNNKEEMFKTD